MHVLKSQEDKSINIIMNGFEARFVQREDDYFIIYVSSQKGCAQHCRMCHLTATGQTDTSIATIADYVSQVVTVLNHIDKDNTDMNKIRKVHINFMARGEPMENVYVTTQWQALSSALSKEVIDYFGKSGEGVEIKFIISTIFPDSPDAGYLYTKALMAFAYSNNPPAIYYSLYSTDEEVRKKWLPRALAVKKSLTALSLYGNLLKINNRPIRNKIHHAFIKGVNDTSEEAHKLMEMLHSPEFGCLADIPFNIVRYNPYDKRYGREAHIADMIMVTNIYESRNHAVKIIPRVGRDVFASCGTFYSEEPA